MDWKERLQQNLVHYQSIPFWSWNDKLAPEELRRQIRAMKKAGIGGFFMHARGGLMTEYLGEDWFTATAACIDEAKKQGMHAWCYDENGWPSGFAGMKLLENRENWEHYIVCETKQAFDPTAMAVYALGKTYSRDVIRKWLKVFYRRFFSQQFKRSCVPDGPKVGTAALSPRGDWRMPSDASAALWQAELETLE